MMTVWCLGCSAYQPVLAAVLGLPTSVVCSDDMPVASQALAGETASEASAVSDLKTPESDSEPDVTCGCQSCSAPVAGQDAPVIAAAPFVAPADATPQQPASIVSEPRDPPPQRLS
jgi:hypothetical protein